MLLGQTIDSRDIQCRDYCGFDGINLTLIEILEDFRNYIEDLIYIDTACVCEDYNRQIKGIKDSAHLKGNAIDFHTKRIYTFALEKRLKEFLDKRKYKNILIKNHANSLHLEIIQKKEE